MIFYSLENDTLSKIFSGKSKFMVFYSKCHCDFWHIINWPNYRHKIDVHKKFRDFPRPNLIFWNSRTFPGPGKVIIEFLDFSRFLRTGGPWLLTHILRSITSFTVNKYTIQYSMSGMRLKFHQKSRSSDFFGISNLQCSYILLEYSCGRSVEWITSVTGSN